MADTKISQLPSATTPLSGAELVPLVQSGATVQTPTNEISKLTAATANTFTANQIISVTDNVNAALRVTQLGTADALRIEDSTNPDNSPVVVNSAGLVGIGISAPTAQLHVSSSGNTLHKIACAALNSSGIELASDTYTFLSATGGAPLGFAVGGTEVARLSTNGAFTLSGSGGLGYGTGSGGTVTQLTSKSTSVTLNKTNGQITMNNATLAAGASVVFTLLNNTLAAADVLIVVLSSGVSAAQNYRTEVVNSTAGGANIRLTNLSGSSLSEAAVLNFAIIKAVTS